MYKHGGGYYLLNGRWHKLHKDKPAPKGAPVVAHPGAGGTHAAVAHFTQEQWDALKLPDTNTNAPSYNKALANLQQLSDAGNVTGMLAVSYGSNTYGQKLAKIANHLLGLHGSQHQVAPGQKAGTHAALQAPAAPAQPVATTPDLQEPGPLAPLAQHIKDTLDKKAADGDAEFIKKVSVSNPNHPQIEAYAKQKLAELQAKAPAPPPAPAPAPTPAPAPDPSKSTAPTEVFYHGGADVKSHHLSPLTFFTKDKKVAQDYLDGGTQAGDGKVHIVHLDIKNAATDADVEAAAKVVGSWNPHEHAHQYLTESVYGAEAYAVAELLQKKGFDGAKLTDMPMGGGAPIESWVAFDSSQIKEAKESSAAAAPTGPLAMPAFEEGKTTTGVKDYYEKVAQKIIDHGYAGNGAVLVGMKQDGLKPNAKGKVSNTWVGKTANSKKLLALHASALEHATGGKPAADNADPFAVPDAPADSMVGGSGPKDGDTKPGAAGGPLVFKNGRWHKYVDADESGELPPVLVPVSESTAMPDTGPLTAQQLSNLQSIPWYKLKLPAENTNAKSHNAALAKIEAMAFAGDTAGLQAFIDAKAGAKQTYAKKQVLTAQTALAGLGTPGATAAVPVMPEPSKPSAPLLTGVSADRAIATFKSLTPNGSLSDFEAKWKEANAGKVGLNAEWAMAANPAPVAPPPAAPTTPLENQNIKWLVQEHTTKGHNKFWAYAVEGNVLHTAWGKIGTKGQTLSTPFASAKEAKAAGEKKKDAKWAGGYSPASTSQKWVKETFGENPKPAKPDTSPKEGDTKQGADGMLVLKDGHWVKMDEGAALVAGWKKAIAAGKAPTKEQADHLYSLMNDPGGDSDLAMEAFMDAVNDSIPPELQNDNDFDEALETFTNKAHYLQAEALASTPWAAPAPIKKLDLLGVNKILQSLPPSLVPQAKFSANIASKMALAAAKTGDAAGMAAAYSKAFDLGYAKTGNHIQAVAEAMGVDTSKWDGGSVAATQAAPAPAAAQPAAFTVAANGLPSMDSWVQTGGQGGSNPGGKFKDPTGQEWYCKFPGDEATAKSEVLAAKLYGLAGLSGQDAILVSKGGKVGIATKWVDIKKATSAAVLAKVEGARSGFAVDAWLANWDVVGLALDNLQVGPDGKAHRVDAGGSLEYRAQGSKKPFGSKVDEIETMRDKALNPHSAALFAGMTTADIVASVAKVAAISDVTIRAMVNQHGPGDAAAKKAMADTLIARKADLLKRFPQAAKKKKAVVFNPDKISEPPNFLNWGGSGKSGPSSKEFLNKANNDAAQAIFAAAKTGDVGAVQSLKAAVYDKDTGAAKGEAAVVSHPSQHIKGYAQQVINEINYQMNPPKRFRFDGGHPLHSLNAAYPAHQGVPSSDAAQKLGKFIVLGEPGTVKLSDLGLPPTIKHSEAGGTLTQATYSKQAQAAIAKMPATQQQAIQSYTGSSYHAMNGSLWSGNPSGAAKAAGEALKTLGHDIAPGTVLSRKISLHGAELDQLLAASGKILQEPAIMSTSIRPSSWSGNVHLKLHVGPGVKGLWVGPGSKPGGGALSKHSSEDELILPPGTRLMIMSVKKGGDADGFGKNGQHVIEAVVLPT